jgi:hypothetical protein
MLVNFDLWLDEIERTLNHLQADPDRARENADFIATLERDLVKLEADRPAMVDDFARHSIEGAI